MTTYSGRCHLRYRLRNGCRLSSGNLSGLNLLNRGGDSSSVRHYRWLLRRELWMGSSDTSFVYTRKYKDRTMTRRNEKQRKRKIERRKKHTIMVYEETKRASRPVDAGKERER